MTLAIILLHMFWGIVFFESCERRRWWSLAAVVCSHLFVSCLVKKTRVCTLIQCNISVTVQDLHITFPPQTFVNPKYEGSLIPTYMLLCVMAGWAFSCAGGSLRNLSLCLTCKDKDFLLVNHRPR